MKQFLHKIRNIFHLKKHSGLSYRNLVLKYQNENLKDGYLLCFLVLPLVLVYLIESFAAHSVIGGLQFLIFHPYAYLANVLIILTSLTLSLLFCKRFGIVFLVSFIWLFAGVANGILLIFRVTPLGGSDLHLFRDGLNVVFKYLNPAAVIGLGILIAAVIALAVWLFIRTPSAEKKPPYIHSVPIVLGCFLITWGCITAGQASGLIETQFRELSQSYRKNGFIYCFGSSILNVGISKPDGYSLQSMEQLTENFEELADDSDTTAYSHTPNVIFVQLESFFNVNRLKDIQFSRNPIPNFTDMMSSCPSGSFSVPVIGAGTVNSEFEVLTGMNIDDFGIGEYPYKTILKETACESIAYNLKAHDYNTFAIHDHEGSFYDRNKVYPNLGFDTFTSIEYMWPDDDAYTSLDWTKDTVLTDEIETALNSTPGQDFIFAVAVQSHGSYPTDPDVEYTRHMTAYSDTITDEDYLNQVNYYVNQLYEVDEFIGDLCRMLKSRRETTILVMYGDHCPSLDLTDEDLTSGTVYDTEYFIWNNAGLSFDDQDLQAFELNSEILAALNITDGAINTYHQNSTRQLNNQELTEEDYLSGLKELEYDILYGDKIATNGVNPYQPTDLQMGFEPIVIHNVTVTKDHVLIVEGTGFTRYSTVRINGDDKTTLYLDPETLVVADTTLENGDKVTVHQSSLSETIPYPYSKIVHAS